MPIYEYRCAKCGQVTEILVRGARAGDLRCEKCGAKEMEKLFSTFGTSGGGSSSGACMDFT